MTNETVNHYFNICNRFMLERKVLKISLEGTKVKTFDLQTLLSNPQTIHDIENSSDQLKYYYSSAEPSEVPGKLNP